MIGERRNREAEVWGLNSEQTPCILCWKEGTSALQCAVSCKLQGLYLLYSLICPQLCSWVNTYLLQVSLLSQQDGKITGSQLSSCFSNFTTQNSLYHCKALNCSCPGLQHQSYTQNNDRLVLVVILTHLAKSRLESCVLFPVCTDANNNSARTMLVS